MWESSSAMKLGSRANGSYEGIWNQVVQFFKKANAFAVETRARRIGAASCFLKQRHLPRKQYTMFNAVARRAICSASRQTGVVTRQFSALVEATEEFPG